MPEPFPRPTGYKCPECRGPIVMDEESSVLPDEDGNPKESTSIAYYCDRISCDNFDTPISEEDLIIPHSPMNKKLMIHILLFITLPLWAPFICVYFVFKDIWKAIGRYIDLKSKK